ncbi:MAG: hypothetical protein ACI87O_000227 [Planctomycetota bacterium]|jgi:hypothetical protein
MARLDLGGDRIESGPFDAHLDDADYAYGQVRLGLCFQNGEASGVEHANVFSSALKAAIAGFVPDGAIRP